MPAKGGAATHIGEHRQRGRAQVTHRLPLRRLFAHVCIGCTCRREQTAVLWQV